MVLGMGLGHGHADRAAMNRIFALMKEAQESSLAPPTTGGHSEKALSMRKHTLPTSKYASAQILGLPSLQNSEK